MNLIESATLVLHVLAAMAVCGLVLLQHGKGADMGAAFGSGSSGSLFGATGAANFLSRTTAILAVIFFISTLSLTFIGSHKPKASAGVLEGVITPVPASVGANAGKAALPPVDAPAPGQDVPK